MYFFWCFFVYTYYVTFYLILTDIYLLSLYLNKNVYINVFLKKLLDKIIICIPIILLQMPVSGALFFYRIHKEWMKPLICFMLYLILLLLSFILYNLNFVIIAFAINMVLLIFLLVIFYNALYKKFRLLLKLKQYKATVSLFISLILFFTNNSAVLIKLG